MKIKSHEIDPKLEILNSMLIEDLEALLAKHTKFEYKEDFVSGIKQMDLHYDYVKSSEDGHYYYRHVYCDINNSNKKDALISVISHYNYTDTFIEEKNHKYIKMMIKEAQLFIEIENQNTELIIKSRQEKISKTKNAIEYLKSLQVKK